MDAHPNEAQQLEWVSLLPVVLLFATDTYV